MPNSAKGQKTLRRVLNAYLDWLRVYRKPKTVRGAACSARKLLEHFGHCHVAELGPSDLDAFILQRRESGACDKTINGDLVYLRAALNHAVSTGLIRESPFKVRLLKVARRRDRRILTKEELRRLLECSTGRIHGIILVAAHTGFRTSEILHLQWKDVDWGESALRITSKEGIWSSKSHQERRVFVAPEVLDWLKTHRERSRFDGDGDWIFSTHTRRPMRVSNVCRALRPIFKAAGVYEKGQTIHLVRHTAASRLLANGTDLETVRDQLGHADISTTALYLHTTDARKKAASQALSLA